MSNSQTVMNHKHRRKLLLVDLMGGKCSICGYHNCVNALEFHHIDKNTKLFGICNGNTRNLEEDIAEVKKCALVCANCHREIEYSETPPVVFCTFDEAKYQLYLEENQPKSHHGKNLCPVCGKEKSVTADLCLECSRLQRRTVERPSREELKTLIREKSFLEIGRLYGVSDNSIRKWCDAYGLPRKKTVIQSMTDSEWDEI